MRILVTGGAGFIGSHVADALLAADHEVAILDDLSTGRRENVPADAKFYEVDVRDRVGLHRALADFQPHVVSHQAAQISVSMSVRRPQFDAEVNVVGGLNVLDACVEVGAVRVVFASTGGAIYGEVPEGETAAFGRTAAAPSSPYAISKFAFEQYLDSYRRVQGLATCVLRYANVYGPRQSPHGEAGVVAIFAQRLMDGEPLRVFGMRKAGDGGCVRDYVYVQDVVRANVAALTELDDGLTLDVGTGVGTTTAELLAKVQRGVGKRPLDLSQVEPRAGDLCRSVLDGTEFEAKLGPATSLDEGIEATTKWFLGRAL